MVMKIYVVDLESYFNFNQIMTGVQFLEQDVEMKKMLHHMNRFLPV